MEFYPVIALKFKIDGLSGEIAPSAAKEVARRDDETVAGFNMISGVDPDPATSLAYSADPVPGLAWIQGKEQGRRSASAGHEAFDQDCTGGSMSSPRINNRRFSR